jgi:hypothetical protein
MEYLSSELPIRRLSVTLVTLATFGAAVAAAAPDAPFDRSGLAEPAPIEADSTLPLVPTGIIVSATVIARQNELPPGESDPVTALNSPFTNALGEPGFTGTLVGPDSFVWFDDGVLWRNSDETVSVLTGAEGTMGISDAGGFIYSPAVDGGDAVWTHNGALLVEGDPAPDFPPPALSVFNSRPHMIATGRAYWVGGVDLSGGSTTQARALFTSGSATAGDIDVVLRSGDMVGGFPIRSGSSGIGFDYDFSSDGVHHIQELVVDTGSTADDDVVYVDGDVVARQAQPTGEGDSWAGFGSVAINASGHYLFSGDTDGATASDEFIAYDGAIFVREGDDLSGTVLTSPASNIALSLDDEGRAVHLWTTASAEILFFACNASNLLNESVRVLATGDGVDLDGNGTSDAVVTDFNASDVVGPGLDLAGDDRVFVEVDIDDGGGNEEAILRIQLPLCMPFLDGFETGDTSRWSAEQL